MKSEQLLGITPVLKRLAWYYAKQGYGVYPIEHTFYDIVKVRELYEWHTPDEKKTPPQAGVVVEFYRFSKKVRWVEFSISYIGGGGEDILREVI